MEKILNYFNTKAKAFVVFVFSLSALGIFILSSLISMAIFNESDGIGAGIFLMLLAVVAHLFGKKNGGAYILSTFMNSVASGFMVSAYYLKSGMTLYLYDLILGAIPSVGIVFLVYVMLQTFNQTKKVTVTVAAIVNLLLTVALTVLWIIYGDVVFSFGFFCSLISLFFLCVFGITINHDERMVLRDISFGSFGSFIIISVVVIFILSEGDIFDGFDWGDVRTKKQKKKK